MATIEIQPIYRAAESLRRRNPNALPPDITVGESGLVRLPLAVLLADQRINYIPIDWVADMIVAAIDVSARNQTYKSAFIPIRRENTTACSGHSPI